MFKCIKIKITTESSPRIYTCDRYQILTNAHPYVYLSYIHVTYTAIGPVWKKQDA